MTAAASASRTMEKSSQPSLDRCQEAVAAAERLLHLARAGVRKAVEAAGGIDAAQASAHGLAWLATYVESLRQMLGWAQAPRGRGTARRDGAADPRPPPSANTWRRSPAASP